MARPSVPSLAEAARYGNVELWARQVVEGFLVGLHKSPYHGFSVEFSEYRPYQPGDPLRDVDWKVLARTDRLYVKKYEDETNLRCQLIVDVSSSMFYPPDGPLTKYAFAALMTAALLYLLRKQRDAAGLTLFSDRIHYFRAPSTRSVHYRDLFARLDHLLRHPPQRAGTRLMETLREVNLRLPRRSMIIIFSDALVGEGSSDDTEAFLDTFKYLHSRNHDVIFFHTLAYPQEVNFELEGPYLRLEDVETGESVHLSPAEYRATFQQQMSRWMHRLQVELLQYGVDYVPVDVYRSVEQVLLPFLKRRTRRIG